MDWKQAEDFVVDFLCKHRFTILRRNQHIGHDEVDIIAKKSEKIFAFEVRFRNGVATDEIWSYLSQLKYYRLQRSAQSLREIYKKAVYIRIAIVTISLKGTAKIRIFNPSKFTY